MPYVHPRMSTILAYTARRLACETHQVTEPGLTVTVARKPDHPDFMLTAAFKHADVICVTQVGATTIVRTHSEPTAAVEVAVDFLKQGGALAEGALPHAPHVYLQRLDLEPYYYLDPSEFTPFEAGVVRQLSAQDAPLLAQLHETIPEGMRWFVEIDHPVVFGCFEGDHLAAVASQFLFKEEGVAAAGVLTHTGFRRRGYGKSVASAVVDWALARNYLCEWSTWDGNPASMALAQRLGFRQVLTDTEYRVRDDHHSNGTVSVSSSG